MGATIINGKAAASRLHIELAVDVQRMAERYGIRPTLAAILVGDDPASAVYVRRKVEQTEQIGMRSLSFKLPADTTEEELLGIITRLNGDENVHGILVQLPLPPRIDRWKVLTAIDPDKDVDGFHPVNVGRLVLAQPGLAPCTPAGCMMLLRENVGSLEGLHAVVIGCSNIVGRPMAELLLQAHCTVSLTHIHTVNLPEIVSQGDIVVAAAGAPRLVRGSWLKPGAVVIDVGINRVRDEVTGRHQLVGDVCFDEAINHVAAISPVPGGVGPMTIACLLRNTLIAARRLKGLAA